MTAWCSHIAAAAYLCSVVIMMLSMMTACCRHIVAAAYLCSVMIMMLSMMTAWCSHIAAAAYLCFGGPRHYLQGGIVANKVGCGLAISLSQSHSCGGPLLGGHHCCWGLQCSPTHVVQDTEIPC